MDNDVRDILDADGNIIGSLSLPSGTSEEVWTEKLAPYRLAATGPSALELAVSRAHDRMNFGASLIAEFGAMNELSGISTTVTDQLAERLATVQQLLLAGALETAIVKLGAVTADEILPQETIDAFIARLRAYLGI